MSTKKKIERHSFIDENGQRWLQCKHCYDYKKVGKSTGAITCSICVMKIDVMKFPETAFPKQKKSTGRPPGWLFMNEFVDKDGNVFHKGKEQLNLKGTLPPTKITPKKKTKRRTKEQILLDRQKDKKAALRKAVQKQKDFLNHKFGE